MAEGRVLFIKDNERGRFGFLVDDAIGHEDRATDVYFDKRSFAEGVIDVQKGQRVRFEYDPKSEKVRTKFDSMKPLED